MGALAVITIGIDPHKASLTAVAVDASGTPLGRRRLLVNAGTLSQLLAWAAGWPARRFAVEGAYGLGRPIAQQLAAANEPGACAHYRQNQAVANEHWLVVVQIAYRADRQPAPFATGAYQIGVGVTDPDGTLRTVAATYQPHSANCSQGGQRDATSGIVPYTTVTDTLVEGSYDLQFRRARVQGSFSAPMCLLCSPRPTSRTCLDEPA
jgi:hypothetical protein